MATSEGAAVPTVKVEHAPSPQIKEEAPDAIASPYMDEEDVYEDAGDLDFSNSQQEFWLSRIPKSLWQIWSDMPEDGEIEIGTIRVEGDIDDPKRVSMKLNALPQFQKQPKEYNLIPSGRETLQPKQPRNAFVFSEKDMPGYKKKVTGLKDGEGGPHHSRSYLHEKNKRDIKRKEGRKRFQPYVKRPVPKLTSITGVVSHEFECVPVENEEYLRLERQKAETMLKPKEEVQISFQDLKDARYLAPGSFNPYGKTVSAKQEQKKKAAAKENRAARRPKNEVIDNILEQFQFYKFWGLRELRQKTKQPEAYLREILNEIATMWRSGDMNGKWELKPAYTDKDEVIHDAMGMAPDVPDSDEDGDENETFEDV